MELYCPGQKFIGMVLVTDFFVKVGKIVVEINVPLIQRDRFPVVENGFFKLLCFRIEEAKGFIYLKAILPIQPLEKCFIGLNGPLQVFGFLMGLSQPKTEPNVIWIHLYQLPKHADSTREVFRRLIYLKEIEKDVARDLEELEGMLG